ncbi:hypothetical protein PF003_g14721 [Phytophthora fragariae]|nr:hypothetical protein PF003_g14721 [Phytophthora fragariae]
MLGSRVKSIWQTRIIRSKSNESTVSQDDQAAITHSELEQDFRESVVESKVLPAMATPHTPALDADFYKYSMDDSVYVSKAISLDGVTPISPRRLRTLQDRQQSRRHRQPRSYRYPKSPRRIQ